jgi:uncharacterized protein YktA (UPF0223 family)
MEKPIIKVRRLFAALIVLFFAAVLLPGQTEAASVQSLVEKLEHDAKQLEKNIQSTTFSKPYRLYNQTKKSYAEAKKVVDRLKNGPMKRQYNARLSKANHTIQRAAYYISAVESGERLTALKSQLDKALSSGNVDAVYELYFQMDRQLKKSIALFNKVEHSYVRKKMAEKFQRPAEMTKQRAFFPINIMVAFDKIMLAYEKGDVDEAERLLVLCDQWLSQIKDANMKKELNGYLEEFKAPVVLEIE